MYNFIDTHITRLTHKKQKFYITAGYQSASMIDLRMTGARVIAIREATLDTFTSISILNCNTPIGVVPL